MATFPASPVPVSAQGPWGTTLSWSAKLWPRSILAGDDDGNGTTPYAEEQDEELAEWLDLPDLRLAVDCGLIPWLALLGAAGNVLCVVVLLRQRYRSVAQPLLLGLWASDLLLLLAAFTTSLPCLTRRAQGLERGTHLRALLTPQVAVLRDVMARMTVALTTALGVERCVAVTRPLKLRAVCTLPRTRTVVLLLYLVVFALQSPAFFRYDVSHREQPDNGTALSVHRTAFYNRNRRALDFYFDYFLLVMLRALPLVSVLVCFCIVLVCLKRRLQNACPVAKKFAPVSRAGCRHKGGETPDHGDLLLEERRLTRALLLVLLLCLLSELPAFVTEVWRVILPDHHNRPSSFWVSRDVCRLLCTLNSALHFPLFMIMYKNFSVAFRTLMGVCVRT